MPVDLISLSHRGKNRAKRIGFFLGFILAVGFVRFRWTDGLTFPNLLEGYKFNEQLWGRNDSLVAISEDSFISSLSNIQCAVDNSTTSEALPIKNVLLMGQFNYNPESAQSIQDWVSVWCNYFSHIVVTGPFSSEIVHELDAMGIAYGRGRTDSGWVSPYENLANVAQEVAEGIDAVLYIHDDALLNLTYILDRNSGVFPTDRFLWTDYINEFEEADYSYYVQLVQETWENGTVRTFPKNYNHTEGEYFHEISLFEDYQKDHSVAAREYPWTTAAEDSQRPFRVRYSEKPITSPFPDEDDPSINDVGMASTPATFQKIPWAGYWFWYGWCMKHHLIMLVEGPREVLDEYAISVKERSVENIIDGKIVRSVQVSRQFKFHMKMDSDFLLLPMEHSNEFCRLAEVFAKYHIFLESAVPTMVRWMKLKHRKRKKNAGEGADHALVQTQSVSLCTDWDGLRGRVAMIDACLETSAAEGMGMYHPIKPGVYGHEQYQRWQAAVQLPTTAKVRSVFKARYDSATDTDTTADNQILVDNPTTSEALPIKNVLLMGQFNYNPESAQSIQDWVSVWCNYFSHIVVTGPFSSEIVHELDAMGIAYGRGRTDSGWVSPYENLANVAQEVAEGIDAVLYIHDDALLNLTYILDRNSGVFPTDRFLWTDYINEFEEADYSYYVQLVQETWENGTVRTFPKNYNHTEGEYFHEISLFEDYQKDHSVAAREYPWTTAAEDSQRPFRVRYSEKPITSPFPDEDDPSINDVGMASTPATFQKIPWAGYWFWYGWCMKHHLIMLVEGPREVLDEYAISVKERSVENIIDGKIVRSVQVSRQFKFHMKMDSDFLLLPMEHSNEFCRLAEVFAKYHIFLESAVPTMVRWMKLKHRKRKKNAGEGADHALVQTQSVSLCTDWDGLRGRVAMIDACLETSAAEGMGLYHPIKPDMYGHEQYQRLQAAVQLPISDEVRSIFQPEDAPENSSHDRMTD